MVIGDGDLPRTTVEMCFYALLARTINASKIEFSMVYQDNDVYKFYYPQPQDNVSSLSEYTR